MMKKTLSLMLAIAMIISVFAGITIPVSAAEALHEITVGDTVVFVCKDASTEMTSIGNYGVGTAYTEDISGSYVLKVAEGTKEGTYAFYGPDGYLNWTANNTLKADAALNDNSSWNVSFDDAGNAIITNAANTARQIWWNVKSPRFSTYEGKTANADYFSIQLCAASGDIEIPEPELPEDPTEPSLPEDPTEPEAPIIPGNFGKATELKVGERVVLVCEGAAMEMSAVTTYGVGTSYDKAIVGYMTLDVLAGTVENSFAFHSVDGYLNWTKSNTLDLVTEISDNASWFVAIDAEGNATISNAANADRVIWWNNGSPRFSTYEGKSATATYLNVQLYKELAEGECAHYDATSVITVPASCTTDGVMTWTCTCGATWTTVIAAFGHEYENYICIHCGDDITPDAPELPENPETPATGYYVIAAKVNDAYYAMANTFASKIAGTAITVVDGKVAAEDAGAYFITLTEEDGGYTISNGTDYLKYNTGTSLAATAEKYTWTLSAGKNGTWRVAAMTEGRGLVFRAGEYNQFGGYSTANIASSPDEYFDLELLPVEGTPVIPDPTEPTEPTETEPTEPSETEPVETEPVETEPAAPVELEDGQYVIAALVDGVYYAMSNSFQGKIPGTALTVTQGTVAAEDATAYVITVKNVEGGITISSGEDFLKYNSSTNLAKTAEAYVWMLSNGVNGTARVGAQAENRALVFRAGSTMKFGGYSVTNLEAGGTEYFDVEFLPVVGEVVEPSEPIETEPTVPTEPSEPSEPTESQPTEPSELPEEPEVPEVPVTFEGYEKASAVVVGDKVVMICEAASMELTELTTSSSGIGTGTAYTDKLSGMLVFEIVNGAKEGTYGFKTANGYMSWGTGNSLLLAETFNENGSWTVSFDEAGNAILANCANADRVIWWSNSYDRFTTYEGKSANSNYTNVQLYLKTTEDEVEEPTLVEGIKIGHTLNLASDISINFAVATSVLNAYDSYYLECKLPVYENSVISGYNTVEVQPVLNGNYYYFTLMGVTAVMMNDMVEATLHMTKGGEQFVSAVDSYSVGTYAYSQLNKSNASASLKALCADLLRYGACAQIYKNYRTDALVNASMTPAMIALLSDIEAVTFNNVKEEIVQIDNPTVLLRGRSLSLESKVTLNYILNLSNYKGKLEDLNVRVSYTDIQGKTKTVVLTDAVVYDAEQNFYSFSFDSLLAAELRTVLTAVVYEGDTQVSNAFTYTIDTYGNGKKGALLDLCKALMAYSDTALAYFVG